MSGLRQFLGAISSGMKCKDTADLDRLKERSIAQDAMYQSAKARLDHAIEEAIRKQAARPVRRNTAIRRLPQR